MNDKNYPPYHITKRMIHLVSEISESIGHISGSHSQNLTPFLRRKNRIQTVHASLAIENNTLSLDQATALLNGERVFGDKKEIQEIKNAFEVYENLDTLNPFSEEDFLKAHQILMNTLIPKEGQYRRKSVGVIEGNKVIHIAPPSEQIPRLMKNLFHWIKTTDEHPLIASSVFHYELEFIHPFLDGNGRMGRLWQTLILKNWKPIFSSLPVESFIRKKQELYYENLHKSDLNASSVEFIEFMLTVILDSVNESLDTDQETDQDTDQVKKLLLAYDCDVLSKNELMRKLSLSHNQTFRKNYLYPALKMRFIEMTVPDKPQSPLQKYRITEKGKLKARNY